MYRCKTDVGSVSILVISLQPVGQHWHFLKRKTTQRWANMDGSLLTLVVQCWPSGQNYVGQTLAPNIGPMIPTSVNPTQLICILSKCGKTYPTCQSISVYSAFLPLQPCRQIAVHSRCFRFADSATHSCSCWDAL